MAKKRTRKGVSEAVAAQHFQVSKTTIQRWKKRGWTILYGDGSIDIKGTAKEVAARKDPRGGKPDRLTNPDDEGSLLEARTRKEKALARKAELEVARLQGDLIPLAEATRAYVEVITAAKATLEHIPRRVADQLVGLSDAHEIRRILTAEIADALRGLSEVPDVE